MGAAKAFAFGGKQVDWRVAQAGQQFGIGAGHFGEQDEFSNFVKDARRGTFINDILGAFFGYGNALGEAGDRDAVFPENSAIDG